MNTTQRKLIWTAAGLAGVALVRLLTHKHRSIELANKVVLITGGSRGLGLEIARQMVKEGARVVICARDKSKLKRAKEDLDELAASYGTDGVYAIPCDITREDQMHSMLDRIKKHFGPVEILINNAGLLHIAPAEEMGAEEYEEAMNVHFWAPYRLMEAVIPEMKKKHEGRIVNIASLAGKVIVPHLAPYTASKHALVGLSESLHAEMQKHNIFITTVCPALMRTGSIKKLAQSEGARQEHALAEFVATQPFTSMDVKHAAEHIVTACKHGETSLIMPLQGKVIAAANGLFPGLFADVMGVLNRMLPNLNRLGREGNKNVHSKSDWVPFLLKSMTDNIVK